MDDLISRKALLEKVQYRIDTPGIIGSTIRDMVATTRRIIEEEPAVAYNLSPTETQWIPAAEKLPEEHESIFARFYGTKSWMPGMFCMVSDTVIAAVLYEDGKRTVKAMHTQDGKWHHPGMVGIKEVTHWMPMPLPPANLRR